MAFSSNTLDPGWRCDACDYCLEGLPDRGDQIQCPECGHFGRSLASPLSPLAIAGFGAAAPISVLSGIVATFLFASSQSARRYGYAETAAIELGIAVGLLYVGIAVWFVPRRQFPLIRWFGALAAIALVVWCLAELRAPWHGSLVVLPFLVYGILASVLLSSPEIASSLQRLRRKARP